MRLLQKVRGVNWGESGKSCCGCHCCLRPVPRLLSYPKEPRFIEVWTSAKWLKGTEFFSSLFWILPLLWGFHWFGLIGEMYRFPSLVCRHYDSQSLSVGLSETFIYCRHFLSIWNLQCTLVRAHWCMAKILVAFIHSARTGDFNWSQLTNRKVIYFKVFARAFSLYWKWGLISLRMKPMRVCGSGKSKWVMDFNSIRTISQLTL